MFCPSCGQQQTPEAARFCPRCGFPQYGVINLLNAGGQWPEVSGSASPTISPRKRGVKLGAMIFFLGIVLTPLVGIITDGSPATGIAAIVFILGGLLRMLYAAIFEEGQQAPPPVFNAAPPLAAYMPPGQPLFSAAPQAHSALPPPQQTPIPTSAWRPPHDTQEIITPGSVTEHTTRMLKRETE